MTPVPCSISILARARADSRTVIERSSPVPPSLCTTRKPNSVCKNETTGTMHTRPPYILARQDAARPRVWSGEVFFRASEALRDFLSSERSVARFSFERAKRCSFPFCCSQWARGASRSSRDLELAFLPRKNVSRQRTRGRLIFRRKMRGPSRPRQGQTRLTASAPISAPRRRDHAPHERQLTAERPKS